jgi:uroporphyrinogen-III synthase
MRILITRPREDADSFAATLGARGIEVTLEPLLTIQPVADPVIDLDGVQAILFTSANGVRCFAAASARRDLKVFAVGDASAAIARAHGFTTVESAAGDVGSLATLVADRVKPGDGALLHAAGSSLAGDLKGQLEQAGYTVRRATLYDAVPAGELSSATLMNLRLGGIDAVALFSPRSARTFVELWRKARQPGQSGDGLAQVTALCLSAAVAREVKDLDWRRIEIAARPEGPAMLDLALQERQRREAEMANPATEPGSESISERDGIDERTRAEAASDAAAGAAIVAAMPKPPSSGRGSSLVLGLLAGAVAGAGMVVAEPYWRPLLPIPAAETAGPDLAAIRAELATLKQQMTSQPAVDIEARRNIEALQGEITHWKDQLAQATGNSGNAPTPIDLGPIEMRLAALEEQIKELAAAPARGEATTQGVAPGAIAAPPEGPAPQSVAEIDALATRMAELESKFTALGDTTTRLDFLSSETATQKAEIETAKARLENIAALGERLAALEEQAKALDADIGEVSRANTDAVLKRQRAAALVMTLGQLRAALADAAPFAAQLAAAKDLGGADGDFAARLEAPIAALQPFAADGVPTLAQLQAEFPAARIAQAAAADAAGTALGVESSWLQKTLDRLSELVTVRPVGDVEGDGALAHLARAEARLGDGDLATAVAEIEALEGQAAQAAAAWLARAKARLTVDATAAELGNLSAEALAPAVEAGESAPLEPSN